MKRVLILTLVALLAIGFASYGLRRCSESDGTDAFCISDDEEFHWGTGLDVDMGYLTDDANANYFAISLPEGGAVNVPVLGVGIGLDGVDLGLFDGETFPGIFLMDADRDSYIALTWDSDDNPEIEVGGAATTVTIPGITGYVLGDDTDLALGTGSPASIEYTTADANANCPILHLPTGGATDVPVFGIVQADADFGYHNGVTETLFFIEDADGDSYGAMTFSADDTFIFDVGGSATTVGFIDNVLFGVDATGVDVTFRGDTTLYKTWWDQDGDTNGAWYFGADDYGVDVEFYGQTADYNVTWDASADSWLFGADDLGVDVSVFGAGTGNYVTFDESIDTASFVDYNIKIDDDAIVYIGTGTNVTTADGDFTIQGASDTRMDISATAANSQVCIGDGTVATDFLIDNATTATNDVWFDASADSGNGTFYFGVNDEGVDTVLYGATAGVDITWDASADELEVDAGIDINDQLALKMTSTGDTWDPASIAAGAEEAKEVTVSGAALGDFCLVSFSLDVADLVLDAQVTATDTVTCILANNTGGAIDLASGTVRVVVIQND